MPGHNMCQIKCEPKSEEEITPYVSRGFLSSQKLGARSVATSGVAAAPGEALEETTALEELAPLTPAGPAATPVCVKHESSEPQHTANLEVLEPVTYGSTMASTLIDRHRNKSGISDFMNILPIKDEPTSEGEQHLSDDDTSDSYGTQDNYTRGSPKSWTQLDMDNALDALKNHNMTLTKASAKYGIPSTTLWQRAHRLGIDTPKKEGSAKSWSEDDLRAALNALRNGAISANKASKAYGIPSSTLYKIARREGIRLAAPFNAAPTAWQRSDLARALAAIRAGRASVQRAAAQYGIPTGTLYGRCKREGIELSRSNPTPWSEDAMGEALEAVRVGQMSINQAAIHYNLPYSSLYGRFKRIKCHTQDSQGYQHAQQIFTSNPEAIEQQIPSYYQPVNQIGQNTVHHLPETSSQNTLVLNSHDLETDQSTNFRPTVEQEQFEMGQMFFSRQHCNSEITS